jgi:hypothetical protein
MSKRSHGSEVFNADQLPSARASQAPAGLFNLFRDVDSREFNWYSEEVFKAKFHRLLDSDRRRYLSLLGDPQPRPELNGHLLMNERGTVWLVVGGVAWGYASDDVFRRIHFREVGGCDRNGCCWKRPVFTPIVDIGFITNSVMDSGVTVRADSRGTVWLIFYGQRFGFTSQNAFDDYQCDYGKIGGITDTELGSIPNPFNLAELPSDDRCVRFWPGGHGNSGCCL